MKAVLPIPTLLNTDSSRWSPDPDDPEWEMIFWPHVIFGDMGTFSGVSVIWFDPVKLLNPRISVTQSFMAWWSDYLSGNENDQATEFLRLCRGLGDEQGLAIGLEKFRVKQVNMSDEFLSSPRIASKIEYGLYMGIKEQDNVVRRRPVFWHEPQEIDYTDRGNERLKAVDMYVPGLDHRNDATKHAIMHLTKVRNKGLAFFQKVYGWNPDWVNG